MKFQQHETAGSAIASGINEILGYQNPVAGTLANGYFGGYGCRWCDGSRALFTVLPDGMESVSVSLTEKLRELMPSIDIVIGREARGMGIQISAYFDGVPAPFPKLNSSRREGESAVVHELTMAHTIIAVMLQHLTPTEKNDCATQLEALGLNTGGMTRANEREKLLRALGVDVSIPAHQRKFPSLAKIANPNTRAVLEPEKREIFKTTRGPAQADAGAN